MKRYEGLAGRVKPDAAGLLANLARKGTPRRVHHMELFHDGEIAHAIVERFSLLPRVKPGHPDYWRHAYLAVHRFLGFDYVFSGLDGQSWNFRDNRAADTAREHGRGNRDFRDEHVGPITNWEQFEKYPWPDPNAAGVTASLEWWDKNLPDDMCIVGFGLGHFFEYLSWLPGYETLCLLLYDNRPLVKAIADRLQVHFEVVTRRMLEFKKVKILFPSDDMGFRGGTMVSPADLREFVLPGHRKLARMAHDAGRLCLLHSCGNLSDIIDDIVDCGFDGKHSFEDTIEDVRGAKKTYGRKMSLIGGIDVDFLCRSDEPAIRKRVRETLDVCMQGGGYCLGTGNSVANYIPLVNYLAMVDEGRLYTGNGAA